MTDIIAVIGNPNPGGRTTTAAQAVASAIAGVLPDRSEVSTLELATIAPRLFEWDDESVASATQRVADADLVVFACPTYKATYTGLLKSFLDRYGTDGLAGTVGVPLMIGGSQAHALAPEVHLRPLLVELGVSVPSRGLFVLDTDLDALPSLVDAWLERAGPILVRALT